MENILRHLIIKPARAGIKRLKKGPRDLKKISFNQILGLLVNVFTLLVTSVISGVAIFIYKSQWSAIEYFVIGPVISFVFTSLLMGISMGNWHFRSSVFDYFTEFGGASKLWPKSVLFSALSIVLVAILFVEGADGLKIIPIIILGWFGGHYAKEIFKIRGDV